MKWMSCSACRADIATGARYWACSVSTCNRSRTRLVFCSVACWDSHVSVLRHRDAWAVEEIAPGAPGAAPVAPVAPAPRPAPVAPAPAPRTAAPPAAATPASVPSAPAPAPLGPVGDDDVLIVVSRMKKYIRDRAGLSCGDAVAEALTLHVRALCDAAIRAAVTDGRKTVLERDVPKIARA